MRVCSTLMRLVDSCDFVDSWRACVCSTEAELPARPYLVEVARIVLALAVIAEVLASSSQQICHLAFCQSALPEVDRRRHPIRHDDHYHYAHPT